MKQIFTKILQALVLLLFVLPIRAQNEVNTEFITKMNTLFSPLEKNRVPHGLLLDYSLELADLKSYNGVITDSNQVSAGTLRDIYATIFSSAIHTNAGGFYSPEYVDSLWDSQRQPGTITLSGVYFNYAQFRDDAVSAHLITVANGKIYDKYIFGMWRNPYQTKTVFAMSPAVHAYSGRNFDVMLPSNLWFTNNGVAVTNVAADFNDGTGYRTLTMNQPVNLNYADTGTKAWTFRLTLSNNTTLYSHTLITVGPEPNPYGAGSSMGRYPRPGGPIPIIASGVLSGTGGQPAEGWITIDYANPADVNTGLYRLVRPLIVVEGWDAGHLITPENQYGFMSFETFKKQLTDDDASADLLNLLQSDNQQYDIIYVDWKKGTDYIQNNGYLLATIIAWVNQEKLNDGCLEPNVVLGQSMGGVVARWALRYMETAGMTHDTRLFISWDSPHLGANVPLSFQHANRHAHNLFYQTAVPYLLGGQNQVKLIKNALHLIDEPATRQLLANRVNDNGTLVNADYNAWQQILRTMGMPQQCRNIAVSNGSECGEGLGIQPGATLISFNGKANTRILSDLLGNGAFFYGSLLSPAFLLGIIPGRNEFHVEAICNAQLPSSSHVMYKCKIEYTKKVLWAVNINVTFTNRTRYAETSVLPIDGTAGGRYDLPLNLQNSSFKNWAIKYSITASNVPYFSFIPTVSSLNIGGGNIPLSITEYYASYVGANPPLFPYNTPFNNFTTAYNRSVKAINNNESHIDITDRNGNFVAQELNGNINIRTNCSALCGAIINGADAICDDGLYSVPNIPGATYSWQVQSFLPIATVINNNTVLISRQGEGSGKIIIIVDIALDGCGTTTVSKEIQFGNTPTEIIGPYDPNDGMPVIAAYQYNPYYFVPWETSNYFPAISYTWTTTAPSGASYNYYGSQPFIAFDEFGQYNLQVQKITACGMITSSIPVTVMKNLGGFGLKTNPNPVENQSMIVTIDDKNTKSNDRHVRGIVLVQLYNFNSTMKVKEWKINSQQNQFQLDLRGIPSGNYILVINKDGTRNSKHILIR